MVSWPITTGTLDAVGHTGDLGDEHQEGVGTQLPGLLQQPNAR